MTINQRSKRSITKKLSRLLTLSLITTVFVAVPVAHAIPGTTITTSAELIAAGINPGVTTVNIAANITLTSNLVINHSMSVYGGDGVVSSSTLYGHGIIIQNSAIVSLNHLQLQGVVSQPDGNYGVMIQDSSYVSAHGIVMVLNTPGNDNDAFNVASGSSLILDSSNISWGSAISHGTQQYGVYAQSGATSISFTGDSFNFSAPNTAGAHSYLIGMQGALIANYPAITIGTSTYNSEMKLLLNGADTVVNKQAYAKIHSVAVTTTNNKIGIMDGTNDGIYTYYAVDGWGLNTEAQLRAALLTLDSDLYVGKDIALTTDLSIGRSVTVHGNGFTFTGAGIITSGAAHVSLSALHLSGVVHQVGDGNYGVMVQGSSQLTADDITMVLNTPGENNVGFNVNAVATLALSNSNISWGSAVATGTQQYGVYAQSGAGSISFTNNAFTFNAPNSSGAYSYLIGMEGALVSNYPAIVRVDAATTYLVGMKYLLSGTDTWANKEIYAQTHSPEITTGTFNVGTIGSAPGKADGVYAVDAVNWGVHNQSELISAIAGSESQIYLRNDIALSSNVSIGRSLTLEGNGYTLSGAGLITTGIAHVSLSSLQLTGVVNQVGDGNYGVMVQGASQLTADDITMVLNTSGENNVGFNINSGASLILNNSQISWGSNVATGTQQYGVYAQSGAVAIAFTGNSFVFSSPNSAGAHSYLIGMEGASVTNYPAVTIETSTYNSEMKLFMYGADTVMNKQSYARTHSVTSTEFDNKIGIVDGTNNGIYTYYSDGWVVYTATIGGIVAPIIGATPVTTSTATSQFTGTVTWAPSVASTFAGSTSYTATITLTAINGYTFAHVPANFFTVAGATTVTNSIGSGVVMAVFPATSAAPIYYYAQVALVAVPAATTVQITKTTTLSTTGGSGTGAVTYTTSTPLICSVSVGVVTAITAGNCLITATKATDGNYYSATSSAITIIVSDSDEVAAAAAKVIADKLAADKAAADKVIADAAAAKAAADQELADKAAADKELADAATAAAAVLAASLSNTIVVSAASWASSQQIKINLDFSYKFAYQSATVQFGTKSVKAGKTTWKYVDYYHVILDAQGNAVFARVVSAKGALVLKVGMQVRVVINSKVIKTNTITKL